MAEASDSSPECCGFESRRPYMTEKELVMALFVTLLELDGGEGLKSPGWIKDLNFETAVGIVNKLKELKVVKLEGE